MSDDFSDAEMLLAHKSSLTDEETNWGKNQDMNWKSEDVLKLVFNLSKEGLMICNKEGIVKEVNDSYCSLLHKTREEVIGYVVTDHVLNHDNYTEFELNELLNWKDPKLICLRQQNGNLLPARIVLNKISDNKFLTIVNREVIARWNYDEIIQKLEELQFNKDLLEERSAELNILSTQLAQSEEELKELNASKDKFFSILAHDLKSPFGGLLGYMELLVEDFDTLTLDEIKEFVGRVRTMVVNIYDLTKNLLDWSRLQNGRMECSIERHNVHEAVSYTANLINANARNKGIAIINNVDKSVNVLADNMMLNLVFQNLLSNAIKFTPRDGKITISSKPIGIFHEIQIVDTGIGMSEATLQKVFRIESVHTTLGTENEKGTGLGLILCKEMIERQKGAISVQSKLNEGTTFSFILPSADEDDAKYKNNVIDDK